MLKLLKSCIAILIVSILFFCSCQKDDFSREKEKVTFTSTETSLRSSLNDCENLILNGDFEIGIEGSDAVGLGDVDFWNCYNGTSDLFSDTYSPFWAPGVYTFQDGELFLCTTWDDAHQEGVSQRVEIKPNYNYCLSIDVASTTFSNYNNNGNLTLHS